jgi:hypothetical protein
MGTLGVESYEMHTIPLRVLYQERTKYPRVREEYDKGANLLSHTRDSLQLREVIRDKQYAVIPTNYNGNSRNRNRRDNSPSGKFGYKRVWGKSGCSNEGESPEEIR